MDVNKTIKGVIFDFDGTLFHLEVNWEKLNQILQSAFGVDSLARLDGIPSRQRKQVLEVIEEHELSGIRKGRALPGALYILNSLSKSYKLAIASRNNHRVVSAGMKKIGFNQDLLVIGREDVDKYKPNPEAVQLALKKLELLPGQVVIVGDTTHDVAAAKAIGAIAIVVHNPTLTFTPQGAQYYIENIGELLPLLASIDSESRR